MSVNSSSEIRSAYAASRIGEEKEVAYPLIAKRVGEILLGDWAKDSEAEHKNLVKAVNEAISNIKKNTDKDAALVNNVCTAYAFVISTISAESTKVVKKSVAQARKAFQKAVAYKPVKEGEELDADLFLVECDLVEVEPEA